MFLEPNLDLLVFVERGKLENPEKTHRSDVRNQQQNSMHLWYSSRIQMQARLVEAISLSHHFAHTATYTVQHLVG